jgi:phytoene dehydrogenase-like protein
MNVKSGGYPVGGSKKFIDLIEKRYRDLNGKLYANMPVKKIIINNNTATGVITSDNLEHAARLVISASDLQHTLKDLLNQPALTSKQIEKTAHFSVFPSLLQISLGLKRQFPGVPYKIQMPLIEKITLGDSLVLEDMMVRICSFDQTLAPPGCTSIAVHFRTPDYEFWTDLRKNNRKEYQLLKKKIADAVIDTLDKRFGNVRETVEEIDVATPATYIRYTNIYKGSYQGWAPVPGLIGKTLPKQIKQLKNFYFSGQWVWPAGGLPGVIRIGRQTAQIICRRDGKKFTVSGSKV